MFMKEFNDVNVIAVPTAKETCLVLNLTTNKYSYGPYIKNDLLRFDEQGYHIYLILKGSTIRQGDWVYNFSAVDEKNRLVSCELPSTVLNAKKFETWQKIIATTDTSLGITLLDESFMKSYCMLPFESIFLKFEYGRIGDVKELGGIVEDFKPIVTDDNYLVI